MRGPLMPLIYFTLIMIGIAALFTGFTMAVSMRESIGLRWEHIPLTLLIIFCFGLPIRNWVVLRKRRRSQK